MTIIYFTARKKHFRLISVAVRVVTISRSKRHAFVKTTMKQLWFVKLKQIAPMYRPCMFKTDVKIMKITIITPWKKNGEKIRACLILFSIFWFKNCFLNNFTLLSKSISHSKIYVSFEIFSKTKNKKTDSWEVFSHPLLNALNLMFKG